MTIPAQLVILTLGVADLDRSITFFEALGWERRGDRAQGIVWFGTTGSWLGLFPAAELAKDCGLALEPLPAFRNSTLAINLATEADVDTAFAQFIAAGATGVKVPTRMEWGGYSCYVADLDGHLWELACNPLFPLDGEGRIDIR